MAEHDDDLEAEVDENAEFETLEFPVFTEDDEPDTVEKGPPGQQPERDPDESEI
jgi:hypothetical protein